MSSRQQQSSPVSPAEVGGDQLALIKIEGMHCHKCEQAIKKALAKYRDIHEVEVDFASGQASVLYRPGSVTIKQMMDAINESGYRATGFSQRGQA